MISDEAVEAGARAVFSIRENGTPLLKEKDVIRTALQAALPVLLGGKAEEIARVIAGEVNATGWNSVYASPHFAGKQSADRLWPSWPDALVKTDRIISILTGESDER